MVKTLWPGLIHGDVPQTDQIWQATRFVCDRNLNSKTRHGIVAELICGCQKFGIARGISSYLGVMPVGIFRHVIVAAGCPVTRLGPPSASATMTLLPPTSMCRQRPSRWCNSSVPSAAAQAKSAKHRNPAQRATSKVGIVPMRTITSNVQLEERRYGQLLHRPRSRKYHLARV
jgi:hypothetical protein